MVRFRGFVWTLFATGILAAQTLSNATLDGKYNFRQVLLVTDSAENITDMRSLSGAITFDGAGNFAFTGQQTVLTAAPAPLNGNGTYSVSPAGFVTLANPLNTPLGQNLTINARYGSVAAGEGALIGSSTEEPAGVFDIFVAIPAPGAATSNATLSGSYFVHTLEFPAASASFVRNTLFHVQADGQGNFSSFNVSGHAANLASGAPVTQTVSGATYAMQGDGSGSALFPGGAAPASLLFGGAKTIYVSPSGNVLLGGSSEAGVHDLLVGFQALPGTSSAASWTGKFWGAGLRFETGGAASAYAGSLNADGHGTLTLTRRLHQLQPTGAITYDFTGVNAYTVGADGSGTAELTQIALGADGNAFVGAAINSHDPAGYEVYLGVRSPALAGTGVFLHPQGVFNAASFAPAGDPISPGEFITLFGSGLAPQAQTAAPPYPFSLPPVSVTINNRPAPLYFVSDGQINALVPYATAESTATIVVNNNGQLSNPVTVPVAATAPGVFSMSGNGIGPGAIQHTDFTLVNTASPAKPGETVVVYLTGLGAVVPPVADGAYALSAPPFNVVTAPVNVLIAGKAATVLYSGLAPCCPGLYQLNVTIPTDVPVLAAGPFPLAIQTPDSFHDQVDIIISP